ncbi:MAG: site-specific integrase [Actinomycetota bacterium]|jgi:integrase|nr:site-specific integrase [Actinomycetota bacterium]MDQ3527485.1 site-specific integrase [Actinomycetota bacterium]
MTVVPFAHPAAEAPPSARLSWAGFVRELLEPGWRTPEWDPMTLTFVGSLGSPATDISVCLRPGCGIVVDGARAWCSGCRKVRRQLDPDQPLPRRVPNPQWAGRTDVAAQFSLAGLRPLVRDELLYGLQDHDRNRLAIRPQQVRLLVGKIPSATESILDLADARFSGLQRSLLRSIQQSVRRLRTVHAGEDGTSGDVWDCAVVGLCAGRERPYPAVSGQLDFTVIRQPWLRDITREALRALRPPVTDCHRYIQVVAIASSVLTGRPHGDHPSHLGAGDMTAICQAFHTAADPKTGAAYSPSHRRSLASWWRRLTEFSRSAGLMDTIPGTFSVRPDHIMGAVETTEDDIGRVIPEEWIAHLDAHLHLLGTSSSYRPHGWTAEDLREMYRVYYQVLRDTGRRPSEVARLPDQPIEYTNGQPSLIYDNTKAGRHRRRLPIDQTTASVIEQWSARLATMHVPADCAGYLFPTPGARNRARRGHLSGSQFRRAFVAWLTLVPEPAGLSQDAAAFPVEHIDPYGFRHAFAQRHADSGTAIDVLRDLMDHKEIETTMGYYRVTLTRKQKAVQLVAQLALERNGAAAPFASELAYERASVATAYGNCTEPSNVKAGGKSCPIRFQCSGCGFYRPDPSYLASIEQQQAQLRADRAVARAGDVARWVLDNLDEQIASYERIADTMRRQLVAMPAPERQAVESACTDLRKARQVALIPTDSLRRRRDDQH